VQTGGKDCPDCAVAKILFCNAFGLEVESVTICFLVLSVLIVQGRTILLFRPEFGGRRAAPGVRSLIQPQVFT
jgi:Na+-transporting methylmalonyl-CoA/oxaloacetate decarboxylase gamma subunit